MTKVIIYKGWNITKIQVPCSLYYNGWGWEIKNPILKISDLFPTKRKAMDFINNQSN